MSALAAVSHRASASIDSREKGAPPWTVGSTGSAKRTVEPAPVRGGGNNADPFFVSDEGEAEEDVPTLDLKGAGESDALTSTPEAVSPSATGVKEYPYNTGRAHVVHHQRRADRAGPAGGLSGFLLRFGFRLNALHRDRLTAR